MSRYELSSRFCGGMGAALATVPEEVLPNKCEDVEQVFKQVSKYEKMKALTKLLDENDIKDVDIVVNYDLPTSVEEYVHKDRENRRVGHRGKAAFFDIDHDAGLVDDLTRVSAASTSPCQTSFQLKAPPHARLAMQWVVTSELLLIH
ncbi:hypothetical protein MSG28_005380 [Choristoneura fumiferana]|uniref:Uncharacterized protein n=1 Tax=Choristoneura fumiferana TaxID=7141 RepID=A0ACC0JR00_CHOFU|nr:hypothetical protein MSG28_005380 [Choristoneura fumiferana]